MDALSTLFELLKDGQAQGNFLGFLNVMIGRRIALASDHSVICNGMSWRDLASWLKKVRWDPEAVRELGLNPSALSPRDRRRYWYQAIAQAGVDSRPASQAGDRLAEVLRAAGYLVSSAPGKSTPDPG